MPTQYQTELKLAEGRAETEPKIIAESRPVSPGYFATMRIPLIAGEQCREEIDSTSVVVNRSFANTYLGGSAAIGHRLQPKLRTLHVCPSGAPMSHEFAGERAYFRRDSLNLLSGPQNRVSLPNKVLTSAGLSRLSIAFEMECPIVSASGWQAAASKRERFMERPMGWAFRAVENPVSVADFHATILHLLGFDHTKRFYEVNGNREKLTSNSPARVVNEILV